MTEIDENDLNGSRFEKKILELMGYIFKLEKLDKFDKMPTVQTKNLSKKKTLASKDFTDRGYL